jgi:hypothetical protein
MFRLSNALQGINFNLNTESEYLKTFLNIINKLKSKKYFLRTKKITLNPENCSLKLKRIILLK